MNKGFLTHSFRNVVVPFAVNSFKGVVAPFAAGTFAGNVAGQVQHLITDGELMGSFQNATEHELGTAAIAGMLAAGLTGYALGKWKPKANDNTPS